MVKKIFSHIYVYLILLLMYLPILVLIAYSFSIKVSIGDGYKFGTDLWVNLFTNTKIAREIWTALGNTLIVAIASAAVATLLGTLGAIGAFYSKKRAQKAIELTTQIPVSNAEIVIALSLLVMFVFFGKLFGSDLFGFWTLLIGHVVLAVPFVYLSVKPKLVQMDPHLYEAALDLGATPRQGLVKVIIPEIMPGILSGFLLSITLSLDDFIVTAFTRGSGLLSGEKSIETLSTLIQSKLKKGPIPPEMRPMTLIIFLIVLGIAIGLTIYKNNQAKKIKVRKGRANV